MSERTTRGRPRGRSALLNRAAEFAALRTMIVADGYDVAEAVLERLGRSFARVRLEFEAAEVGAEMLNVLHAVKYADARVRPRSARRVKVIVEGIRELEDE